jgi:hypothetical protein
VDRQQEKGEKGGKEQTSSHFKNRPPRTIANPFSLLSILSALIGILYTRINVKLWKQLRGDSFVNFISFNYLFDFSIELKKVIVPTNQNM